MNDKKQKKVATKIIKEKRAVKRSLAEDIAASSIEANKYRL
jgi:hypothetical protein|tara:strand:+ start:706 stop:828 length:123 start_codon:yes stop_codon:yes gene_type:complete